MAGGKGGASQVSQRTRPIVATAESEREAMLGCRWGVQAGAWGVGRAGQWRLEVHEDLGRVLGGGAEFSRREAT